ncbi:galactose mutarotase [Turicibacter bilis]|uniref:Aldose 1-epimerase n=1 Tax=Turicibacter bilis TaxID=2735723 RepID=A0A9Q9CRT8_9FIRM|nr:aldose epimerase family protein [Turicibacter bilis]MBS3198608.1 galactose mutarotase [Turicibacter bilis]MBS3199314.1 galactose mutarotase [Turicibacter bilis]UUF05790.1 galactose mutarotase [Turicibacter bilis]UUF08767.1 galactose mutarotase [Turicibacter bilis]
MVTYKKLEKGTFNGVNVIEYSMKNEALEVRFLNIGGVLTKIAMAEDQYEQNLVLNYDHIESYFNNGCYLNAIIGRTSNRIKNGQFTINGQTYQLDLNNGPNNLHGGAQCLTYADFEVTEVDSGYELTTVLPHQAEGFPGNLSVKVRYTLEQNSFIVSYEATTDQDTIVNLTQHAYFNLSGNLSTNIYNHELQIKADYIAEIDDNLSFTEKLIPVSNTLFDFNTPTIVNPETKEVLPLFEKASGYDHLYLLSDTKDVVTFKDLTSNRTLKVSTTSPSMQFYAGNFLTEDLVFENGRHGERHLGACFETHLVPFDFESQLLKPGEAYSQSTTFTFTK